MLCGCKGNGNEYVTMCDGEYIVEFVVSNDTNYDAEIFDFDNELLITLDSGQSGTVMTDRIPFADCNPLPIEEFIKTNSDYIERRIDIFRDMEMIVDDIVISDDIWESVHWEFVKDPEIITRGICTLSVTDELVKKE
jgi:hypothetical protein